MNKILLILVCLFLILSISLSCMGGDWCEDKYNGEMIHFKYVKDVCLNDKYEILVIIGNSSRWRDTVIRGLVVIDQFRILNPNMKKGFKLILNLRVNKASQYKHIDRCYKFMADLGWNSDRFIIDIIDTYSDPNTPCPMGEDSFEDE